MPAIQETTVEINLTALAHNYTYLRSKTEKTTRFMGVVKAYAYGADVVAIGRKLEALGANYLAVSYTYEGVALRESGITLPILVFHPQPVHFRDIITHQLMPTLYNWRVLRLFTETVVAENISPYPVHLNLNTGMNRLGFNSRDIEDVAAYILKNKAILVEGIYSHLVASEDPKEKAFTNLQIELFKQMSTVFLKVLPHTPLLHLCNTSGILNYPKAHFDMVRAGIGLYGYGNSPVEDRNLIPVSTLKTPITQLHYLKKGDTVGYNRKFVAEKECCIAILELGYADGLYRAYGNGKSCVWVHGQKAPLVGNICMGMAFAEVTGIPCVEGDEVIIFGPEHPAAVMTKEIGTISYELIAGISQRVKRVILKS